MFEILKRFPEQCRRARSAAAQLSVRPFAPGNVVVAGMGGSGIAGKLLAAYLGSEAPVPVAACDSYHLPRYVGKDTLVVAVSASGNTEETLAVYEEAKKRGAHIIALAGGGALAARCAADRVQLIPFPVEGPARAMLGYQFILLLSLMEKLGIVKNKESEVDEMIRVTEQLVKETSSYRVLAERLQGRTPVIYAADYAVAYRWCTQLNENAKMLAHCHALPEQNHNEINALPHADKRLFFVLLRRRDEGAQMRKRFEFIQSLLPRGSSETLFASGSGGLAQLFSLICAGDFVSCYLAELLKQEAADTSVIERLKGVLTQ